MKEKNEQYYRKINILNYISAQLNVAIHNRDKVDYRENPEMYTKLNKIVETHENDVEELEEELRGYK